ncbi:MAG: glycosyltransferase family 4 protein [Firmicutes bacterium]|nr:glycosyltransferase family 4 protein [Bacillota bacterium]
MKIAVDLTSLHFHMTGIERYASRMSARLLLRHPEEEFELIFAGEVHPLFKPFEGRPGVSFRVLSCKNRLWFSQVRLPLALSRVKADVFFFPAFCAPWFFGGRAMAETMHDMSDFECSEGKGRLKVLYSRLGFRRANRAASVILTVSEFSKRRISAVLGTDPERIAVTYNGVASDWKATLGPEELKEKYGLPDRWLLSVSTLEPRKNIALLLSAFKAIENDHPDLKLVLCGRAGWNPSAVFPEGAPDPERVILTGYVDDGELPLLYGGASAFVFPSKYEGFGLPPLEAMAMGCPVVSSDAASMPEVLGDAAIFFKSEDEDDLVRALKRVLSLSEEERAELTERGRKRAASFSWEEESEKLWSALKKAAECGPKGKRRPKK